jgi:hypothetical protein
MAVSETLNIIVNMIMKGDGAKKAVKGLDSLVKAAKAFAGAAVVGQVVKYTAELTKLGATAQRQATSLDNLAASVGSSGDDITSAIRGASDYTIDRMTAMQAANRALVMDVAKTPEEFERLTRVATALGRAMGQDATKSIDDFVTASARQSQMIADNLGLTVTVGQATERYAKQIGKAADQLTDAEKKQAFLNMMLEEGEKKMAALGDATLDNAGKLEQATATWETFKTLIGEGLSGVLLGAVGDLTKVNVVMDENSDRISALIKLTGRLAASTLLGTGRQAEAIEEFKRVSDEVDSATTSYTAMARAEEEATDRTRELSGVTDEVRDKLRDQVVTGGMLEHTILNTADAIRRDAIGSNEDLMRTVLEASDALEDEAGAMGDVGAAATQMGDYLFDASMSFSDFYKRQAETAEDHNKKVEDLEAEHQQTLAEIAQKGQGWRKKVDEEGLRLEVRIAQGRLEELLDKQAAFGEDTFDLEKAQTERSIRRYQGEIAEKTAILQQAHNGYLTMKGQNVNALIAEENRQYEEEKSLLQASRAEQEAEQRRSLGKMVLQHFTSWAQMQNIEASEMLKMQLDISQKYGLIDSTAASHVAHMANDWAGQLRVMRGESLAFTSAVKEHINSIPSSKTVTINYRTSGDSGDRLEGPSLTKEALGTGFAIGGTALVGERGPELVQLPRGSRVFTAGQTRKMGGAIGGQVVNINNNFYISNPNPEVVVRQIERYMRLKGKTSSGMLGR